MKFDSCGATLYVEFLARMQEQLGESVEGNRKENPTMPKISTLNHVTKQLAAKTQHREDEIVVSNHTKSSREENGAAKNVETAVAFA